MKKRQEEHLQRIKNQFVQAVDLKYRAGAEEHDGDLLDMPALQLLDEAIEENLDQFVYLTTLRDAIRDHGLMVESTAAGFVESESTAGDKYYGGTD